MKLLYVHNAVFLPTSANVLQVQHMCNAFSSFVETTLLTIKGKKKSLLKPSVKKVFVPNKMHYTWRSLALYKKALQIPSDVIYTRDLLVAYLLSRKRKVVYEVHHVPNKHFWKTLFYETASRAQVVSISEGLRKELGVKAVVAPDGVNSEDFSFHMTKKEARKKCGLSGNIIFWQGTFAKWKGYDVLLEASKHINGTVVIAGGKPDEITLLRKEYPDVTFLGFVDYKKLGTYYKAADILVLPISAKEKIGSHFTSPLKLFEFMASERPLVISNVPSLKEIIKDEGLFVKPDDPAALAEGVNSLLEDKVLQKKLARMAKQKVKLYSWKKRAEKIIRRIY